MTPNSFAQLTEFLRRNSGYVLQAEKSYLVESRLKPIADLRGFEDLDDLVAVLGTGKDQLLINDVVEAMTINETSFFRDTSPFRLLIDNVLPTLCETRHPDAHIRIWSAACSIGQEPYSIAMAIKEAAGVIGRRTVEIVATDISPRNVERGRVGLYSDHEIQRGLLPELRDRYFYRTGKAWEASPLLKKMIRFRSFNLLDSYSGMGTFDVIFCRNVLIYLDAETKCQVLCDLADHLSPDGVIFLGAAETVVGVCKTFRPAAGLKGAATLASSPVMTV